MPFLPPNQQRQSTEGISPEHTTLIIHMNIHAAVCHTEFTLLHYKDTVFSAYNYTVVIHLLTILHLFIMPNETKNLLKCL